MQKKYTKITENTLFDNIDEKDFASMLTCLSAFDKTYGKNEVIVAEGDCINFVGAVLEGSVKIIKRDYDGNEVIIGMISEGEIFAEVFACAEIERSPVSIISATESTILFFDYQKIITTCNSSCMFHHRLLANMLKELAHKSLYLNKRIDVISKKYLRDKILTYFYYESMGLKKFTVSMNRDELAKFLCADRSALSNELSKMKKEGLIQYSKNTFELLDVT